MKAAVVVLPGSNCDHDCLHVLRDVLGVDARFVWHKERELPPVDLVVLPGGFSYGDALRAGAIARFAPIMEAVAAHARRGALVFGICNGFQILAEAGLLPGALLRNRDQHFVCQDVRLQVEHVESALTRTTGGRHILTMPVAHGEGRYHIDAEGLRRMEGQGQVLLRYLEDDDRVGEVAGINGSLAGIAGIMNAEGNVFGMMPHPERAAEPLVGGPAHGGSNTDGRLLFEGLLHDAESAR
ncbi:MAG: phosphoribosylformylglycinamidine synthase subunit PurQ [Deltaproteobacteria bacterium]|nr:phosphoribosylformylglycinamidine synthase subunit PurQ [Deltaproteobacteria bacterium]MCB9788854.1 phosphoribosylformylglycinamidine synthase subunit PurQ [Deltaproteobacteria bacterium]